MINTGKGSGMPISSGTTDITDTDGFFEMDHHHSEPKLSVNVDTKLFHEEAEAMIHLHHPHLVPFYGAGMMPSGTAFLVTELMTRTLHELLLTDHDGLSWENRIQYCRDIASGMLFLHTRNPPMIHRDLKADNVLVDNHDKLKICDFGTAARLRSNTPLEVDNMELAEGKNQGSFRMTKTLKIKGSPLWMAPELLKKGGGKHVAPANDVYSYGM